MQVYSLPVGGLETNCYLAMDDDANAVIIDPGAEPERILRMIAENKAHVQHILLTHVHFDHIMAVNDVKKATGADVVIPAADEPSLKDGELSLLNYASNGDECSVRADRTVREGDTVTAGAITLTVVETPGHTRGSCCYLGNGVMFSGDTLFRESTGRTDLPGGDFRTMQKSVKKLKALAGEYTVYPGHGPSTTLTYEKQHNPFFLD